MGVLSSWDDPFTVVGKIPAGLAYQWCTISIMGDYTVAAPYLSEMERNGWAPVPWTRHKKMSRDRQWIVVQGQLLMQKPTHIVKEAEAKRIATSRKMADRDSSGMPLGVSLHSPSPSDLKVIAKQVEDARAAMNNYRGRLYGEFTITIGLTLHDGEIETAVCLGLEPGEYARRKFLMRAHTVQRISSLWYDGSPPIFDFVELKAETVL